MKAREKHLENLSRLDEHEKRYNRIEYYGFDAVNIAEGVVDTMNKQTGQSLFISGRLHNGDEQRYERDQSKRKRNSLNVKQDNKKGILLQAISVPIDCCSAAGNLWLNNSQTLIISVTPQHYIL